MNFAPHIGCNPAQNWLLAALTRSECARILPQLKLVWMSPGDVLYESGTPLRHAYFPATSIVSLLQILEDGASSEIGIVGNEGIVGIALYMGGDTAPNRAVVQSGGYAYRFESHNLKHEFERCEELRRVLLRYTMALLAQTAQTAVCNRHHSLDKQLCRRLLLSLDRLSSDTLTMTQEFIASMLGVRREGVTSAAAKLQAEGLIRYSRGKITVLDRQQLESRVCECYGVVKRELDRLLPHVLELHGAMSTMSSAEVRAPIARHERASPV